jgi:hypothetical protein
MGRLRLSLGGLWLRQLGHQGGAVQLLIELLEHAGGFLASRHAKVQPRLRFGEQRVRIILAVIAALPAILLRHRRHEPARQRLAIGEFHAIGHRHRRVVPRGAVVSFGGVVLRRNGACRAVEKSGQKLRGVGGRYRRDIFRQSEQAGEQAIEPGALLYRERRGFRNEGRNGRPLGNAHTAASGSAIALSASTSCRREKTRNDSSGEARCVR